MIRSSRLEALTVLFANWCSESFQKEDLTAEKPFDEVAMGAGFSQDEIEQWNITQEDIFLPDDEDDEKEVQMPDVGRS